MSNNSDIKNPATNPPSTNDDQGGELTLSPTLSIESKESEKTSKKPRKKPLCRRTKTGCLTCRKRRVKCDETHPICRNCEKRGRHCAGYSDGIQASAYLEPVSNASPNLMQMQPAYFTTTPTQRYVDARSESDQQYLHESADFWKSCNRQPGNNVQAQQVPCDGLGLQYHCPAYPYASSYMQQYGSSNPAFWIQQMGHPQAPAFC